MNKDNVLIDFSKMILESWTYDRMTPKEQIKWEEILRDIRTTSCLKGTYKQRWAILQAIYNSYLIGLGYEDFKL